MNDPVEISKEDFLRKVRELSFEPGKRYKVNDIFFIGADGGNAYYLPDAKGEIQGNVSDNKVDHIGEFNRKRLIQLFNNMEQGLEQISINEKNISILFDKKIDRCELIALNFLL